MINYIIHVPYFIYMKPRNVVKQIPWHPRVSQSHHRPKQAVSHLRELEGPEEAKESSEEMTSSLHGVEACCKEVDYAPIYHREKREMAEKEITTRYKHNQDFPQAQPIIRK